VCLIDGVEVLHPTRHKIGHFRDVLPSQSLGVALKKLNVTQQQQTTQEQIVQAKPRKHKMPNINKCTKTKPKPKATLIFKNCSYVCALSLCTTVVHNTAQNSSDNFPLILQTIIIAQMMSTGGEREVCVQLFSSSNSNNITQHTLTEHPAHGIKWYLEVKRFVTVEHQHKPTELVTERLHWLCFTGSSRSCARPHTTGHFTNWIR